LYVHLHTANNLLTNRSSQKPTQALVDRVAKNVVAVDLSKVPQQELVEHVLALPDVYDWGVVGEETCMFNFHSPLKIQV